MIYLLNITQTVCVSPQAAVIHLPAASVPAECVPDGTHAAGEMEAQDAHHYQ